MYFDLGYRLSHCLLNNLEISAEDLSMIISVTSSPFLVYVTLAFVSLIISNQPVAGSIIVRHMKSSTVPLVPFKVYGPIRSTQTPNVWS